MADPFKKVRPGEPVVFSSTAWNAMLGAGQVYQQGEQDRLADARTTTRRGDIVRVKNESGSDLGRFSVLGLNTPIFTPTDDEDAFLREVTFRGVTPTADHSGKFCILLEPAPDDRVVRAYLAGVCPVRVDVTDEDHEWADVDAGETGFLASAGGGPAQILWKESGTGQKWAVIRFGAGTSGKQPAKAPAGGIAALSGTTPGSATCTLYTWNGTAFSASADTVTVKNPYPSAVGANKFLWIALWEGAWWVVSEAC